MNPSKTMETQLPPRVEISTTHIPHQTIPVRLEYEYTHSLVDQNTGKVLGHPSEVEFGEIEMNVDHTDLSWIEDEIGFDLGRVQDNINEDIEEVWESSGSTKPEVKMEEVTDMLRNDWDLDVG